jgi:thymidine phosphorylase
LNVDPEPQLLASILGKKLAAGSTHVLIDIPAGKGAKVSEKKAKDLAEKFRKIGDHFGLHIEVVITNGSSPIGKGIGPDIRDEDVDRSS